MTAVYYLHLPLAATKVGSLMDTVVALTYESLALARRLRILQYLDYYMYMYHTNSYYGHYMLKNIEPLC